MLVMCLNYTFPDFSFINLMYVCNIDAVLAELKEAVEDVLPTLMEQGITVLLLAKRCNTPGIVSFSDKVEEASDTLLPRSVRSHVTVKSPAVYIYTSGTTGIAAFFQCYVEICIYNL